jgi:hypothetical protein
MILKPFHPINLFIHIIYYILNTGDNLFEEAGMDFILVDKNQS